MNIAFYQYKIAIKSSRNIHWSRLQLWQTQGEKTEHVFSKYKYGEKTEHGKTEDRNQKNWEERVLGGHLLQASNRTLQEGRRALLFVQCWGCCHRLLSEQRAFAISGEDNSSPIKFSPPFSFSFFSYFPHYFLRKIIEKILWYFL